MKSIVIVGANLAGGRAAEQLRSEGFDGGITLVGEEPDLPYERPPLSKEFLCGLVQSDKLHVRHHDFYVQNSIAVRLSQRVDRLDLARRRVVLAGGEELHADGILLCTGARPRRLRINGADLEGVHYLRTIQDTNRLRTGMVPGARVVIIGMGVIGSEVAATAVKLGCEVTAIEPAPVPMLRNFGPYFGAWLGRKHAKMGVRTLLKRNVERFVGERSRLAAVVTNDGERIPADLAIIGVGVEPASELAEAAGVQVENGVMVNRQCRTSSPMVWAAGDVASQPDFFEEHRYVRLETFQNAQEQATAVAGAILGKAVDYLRPARSWTDQFDLSIQLCGRIHPDSTRVVRGDEEGERFSAFFVRHHVIEGFMSVNRMQDTSVGKRLVEQRVQISPQVLADESVPLRSMLPIPPGR
jgi:3-phenylpropionate/trans-cinnamate dioxygenase ferredoxin reductase subunit